MLVFLHLVLISVMSQAASPVTDGKISIGGKGCFGSFVIKRVGNQSDRYELPIQVKLEKKTGSFERKTCNMRLPVALNKNEKLQISDVSQQVKIDGPGAKSSLTISVTGKKSEPLVTTFSTVLKVNGILAESECGRDTMLTGDLNLFASENVSAETYPVQVTLKIVSCN